MVPRFVFQEVFVHDFKIIVSLGERGCRAQILKLSVFKIWRLLYSFKSCSTRRFSKLILPHIQQCGYQYDNCENDHYYHRIFECFNELLFHLPMGRVRSFAIREQEISVMNWMDSKHTTSGIRK